MNEIIKLEEIAHQMEQGLDGLDLFLDTWDNVNFQMQTEGKVISISPVKEITESDAQRDGLYDLLTCGRAYLAGWNAVLGILKGNLEAKRAQECAASATSAASPSHNE